MAIRECRIKGAGRPRDSIHVNHMFTVLLLRQRLSEALAVLGDISFLGFS